MIVFWICELSGDFIIISLEFDNENSGNKYCLLVILLLDIIWGLLVELFFVGKGRD